MHQIDHYLFWEGNSPGVHTGAVQRGLKIGMGLFIASEVMFFAAFFWGYFHAALTPTEASGFVWPPKNIVPFDPFHLPYLNTLLLLLSGTTVTWAHHELLSGDMKNTAKALLITVLLGATFTVVQAIEYSHAAFALKDGIYPSTFYLATGFHGFHVIVGTLFLLVCWWRTERLEFTSTHHVGFEAAAWYWHFVDVRLWFQQIQLLPTFYLKVLQLLGQRRLFPLDVVAVAEFLHGLSVAGVATGNSKLTNAATGIGAGVKVVSTLDGDLSGGITAASATQALQDTAKGVGTIASVSAPGSKAAAQVAKIAGETSDVTGVLLPGGKLTTASALSAGAAIASDVGGKGGTTAAAVLSAVSAAEQAQQGVQTAVNSANPLPSTNA
eukprot:gene15598-15746_t